MTDNANYCCSFCGLSKYQVTILIASNNAPCYICDSCVDKCSGLIHTKTKKIEETIPETDDTEIVIPSPREIKEYLDSYIIGQDEAKMIVSVAAYNHYKRIHNTETDVEIDKSNILLIGPTGCGKTLIAQSLAKFLNVPYTIADATSLTEAGYIGEDVESIIGRLIANANYDVSSAEQGIVFIDEIDKKKLSRSSTAQRDIAGEGVQQSLLKIIEGSEMLVAPAGRRERVKINTKNILFVMSGAFVGLDKIASEKNKKIGFGHQVISLKEPPKKPDGETLIEYGLIPELVGRLPIIATLNALTQEQLFHILTEPKNAITKQFQAMFRMDGIELEFTEEALRGLAKKAMEANTGARGLRGMIEDSLTSTQFVLPEMKNRGIERVLVNLDVFENNAEPVLFSQNNIANG